MFHQCLLVLFGGVLLVLAKEGGGSGIQFRTFFFHKWSVRVVKHQLFLHQIIRGDVRGTFHRLMHTKIIGDQSVFVDGQSVTPVKVARQGGDEIVFTGQETGLIGSIERKDIAGVARFSSNRKPLFIPFKFDFAGQGIAIDTFQLHFCHSLHLEIQSYTATH